MLPPDRSLAGVFGEGVMISYSSMDCLANLLISRRLRSGPREKGCRWCFFRMRLSSTLIPATMPIRIRSSGMWATPQSAILRGDWPVSSRPRITTRPRRGLLRPVSTSTSSRWPLPATPAIPRISPRHTWKDTPRRAGSPRSEEAWRSSTIRASSPGWHTPLDSRNTTSRPTIIRARVGLSTSEMALVPTTFPRRITVTRSATSITSSSLWEMKMTACPSSFIRSSTLNSSWVSWGVSTLVGSSRIRMSAPRYRAFRISTRCCSPAESCHTLALGSTGRL